MTKFIVNREDFIALLKAASCEGTLQFTSKAKIKKNMFEVFIIEAKDEKLTVLARDTHYKKIKQRTVLYDVYVEEPGEIVVSDTAIFYSALDGIDSKCDIFIETDGSKIVIMDTQGNDKYTITQTAEGAGETISEAKSLKEQLKKWSKTHIKLDSGETRFYPPAANMTDEELIEHLETDGFSDGKFADFTMRIAVDKRIS